MTQTAKVFEPLTSTLPIYPEGGGEEDGYELWLRYRPLAGAAAARVRARARSIVLPAKPSLTTLAAAAELHRAVKAMTGREPTMARTSASGSIVLATPKSMPRLATLGLELASLGAEGYLVRAMRLGGKAVTLIAANSDAGVLYGAFAWLTAVRLGKDLARIDQRSVPPPILAVGCITISSQASAIMAASALALFGT